MSDLTRLRKIAHMRASGYSWARIATEFETSESTVVRWTKADADRWKRVYANAVRQIARESTAEAVVNLRQDLRSKEGKERRDAAQKLLRYGQIVNQSPRSKVLNPSKTDAIKASRHTLQIAKYVQSLSPEDLQTLISSLMTDITPQSPHSSP